MPTRSTIAHHAVRFIALSVLMLAALSGNAAAAEWAQTAGPTGGNIRALLNAGGTIYAASHPGGVFRSQDHGLSWSDASGNLPANFAPMALASVGSTVLIASNGAVFSSVDGGATWTAADRGLPDFGIQQLLARGDDLIINVAGAGTSSMLFVSQTRGDEWTAIPAPRAESGSLIELIVTGPHVLALGSLGETFRLDASLESWLPTVAALPPDFYQVIGATDEVAVIRGGFTAGYLRTFDGGDTWLPAGTGMPTSFAFDMELAALGDDLIVAFGNTPLIEFFTSIDDGASWSPIVHAGLPEFFSALTALIPAGDDALLSTSRGIWRSGGGADWSESSAGLMATSIGAVAGVGSNFLAATVFGPPNHRSADDGASWTMLSEPIAQQELISFLALDDTTVLTGSRGGGVFRSGDGGASWLAASGGLPSYGSMSGLQVQPINDFATAGGAVFVATGGGSHFVAGDPHCGCSSVPSGDGVYRSFNLGQSWQRVSTGLPVTMIYFGQPILRPITALAAIDGVLIAATAEHGVFRSTNFGQNWGLTSGVAGGTDLAVLNDVVYLVGPGGGLFRSTTAGASWAAVADDLPDGLQLRRLAVHDGALVATVGMGFNPAPGVYRSGDGGATWSPLASGLQQTAVNVLATLADGALLAGTNGRGVWVFDDAAPEDLNGDGDVDGFDLALLLGAWGLCLAPENCPSDLDGNGVVNGFDLALLLGAWG